MQKTVLVWYQLKPHVMLTVPVLLQDKSVGLRCLTSSSDGHVFAGFHSGHIKCYTGLGRLVWKKVCLAFQSSWSKPCVLSPESLVLNMIS